ncbi:hypothetical protein [Streptomyces griseorubiginosus]|uniref:hypothetical protein n=1 Tax=Streptomyces griseorubiginosus TaxID=67304 RepID=UPI00333399CF
MYATLYSSRLDEALPAALPSQLADLAQSVGAASDVSGRLAAHGDPILAEAVRRTAIGAFDHGLSMGPVVAGLVAAAEQSP